MSAIIIALVGSVTLFLMFLLGKTVGERTSVQASERRKRWVIVILLALGGAVVSPFVIIFIYRVLVEAGLADAGYFWKYFKAAIVFAPLGWGYGVYWGGFQQNKR